jgi:hypothetical protein
VKGYKLWQGHIQTTQNKQTLILIYRFSIHLFHVDGWYLVKFTLEKTFKIQNLGMFFFPEKGTKFVRTKKKNTFPYYQTLTIR